MTVETAAAVLAEVLGRAMYRRPENPAAILKLLAARGYVLQPAAEPEPKSVSEVAKVLAAARAMVVERDRRTTTVSGAQRGPVLGAQHDAYSWVLRMLDELAVGTGKEMHATGEGRVG